MRDSSPYSCQNLMSSKKVRFLQHDRYHAAEFLEWDEEPPEHRSRILVHQDEIDERSRADACSKTCLGCYLCVAAIFMCVFCGLFCIGLLDIIKVLFRPDSCSNPNWLAWSLRIVLGRFAACLLCSSYREPRCLRKVGHLLVLYLV